MRGYLIALSCLSVLPVEVDPAPSREEIAGSRWWYPAAGLFLGLLLAGVAALGMGMGAPLVAAFLVLAAWVGLTGGLHLDGLSDLADALAGGDTAEQRLQILKDPHVGNFGILAIALVLLGKLAALHELIAADRGAGLLAIVAASVTARSLLAVLAAGARYPRPEGTGKLLIEATSWREARYALILTAVLAGLTTLFPLSLVTIWWYCLLWGVSVLAVAGLRQICLEKLGGVTGDCLGAGVEVVETTFLLLAAMALA